MTNKPLIPLCADCGEHPNQCICDNTLKSCDDCKKSFAPEKSISDRYCDSCRLKMWPCLECGADDEYQAGEQCICSGDKDSCHACDYLL